MIDLLAYQDKNYRQFMLKYLPKEENIALIGVRIPILRKLAKQIVKTDYHKFLIESENSEQIYFEEILLTGIVLAYAPLPLAEKQQRIKNYLPKINNWGVCDSFCASFKLTSAENLAYWDFLNKILTSDKPYELRFAIVMLLDYYFSEDFADKALNNVYHVQNTAYTVQMAKAWAFSKYFSLYPEKGFAFLQTHKLSKELLNMTLQKIRDSRKVSTEYKQKIKTL